MSGLNFSNPQGEIDTSRIISEFEFIQYYASVCTNDVLLSYKGPLNNVLLADLIKELREKISFDMSKTAKKVFSIFMEMATNVLYYSKERNCFGSRDSVGNIVITRSSDGYMLMTSNLVFTESVGILSQKLEKINSLDRESLREYKRDLRKGDNPGESKGAGIGLVQMALTSEKPLQVALKQLDSKYSLFIIAIDLEIN